MGGGGVGPVPEHLFGACLAQGHYCKLAGVPWGRGVGREHASVSLGRAVARLGPGPGRVHRFVGRDQGPGSIFNAPAGPSERSAPAPNNPQTSRLAVLALPTAAAGPGGSASERALWLGCACVDWWSPGALPRARWGPGGYRSSAFVFLMARDVGMLWPGHGILVSSRVHRPGPGSQCYAFHCAPVRSAAAHNQIQTSWMPLPAAAGPIIWARPLRLGRL